MVYHHCYFKKLNILWIYNFILKNSKDIITSSNWMSGPLRKLLLKLKNVVDCTKQLKIPKNVGDWERYKIKLC